MEHLHQLQKGKRREEINLIFCCFFPHLHIEFSGSPSASSCLFAAAKQQVTNPRSPVYFKHMPASKRRIFGEQGKNVNAKEKLLLLF